jgi:hypothetical protein
VGLELAAVELASADAERTSAACSTLFSPPPSDSAPQRVIVVDLLLDHRFDLLHRFRQLLDQTLRELRKAF